MNKFMVVFAIAIVIITILVFVVSAIGLFKYSVWLLLYAVLSTFSITVTVNKKSKTYRLIPPLLQMIHMVVFLIVGSYFFWVI